MFTLRRCDPDEQPYNPKKVRVERLAVEAHYDTMAIVIAIIGVGIALWRGNVRIHQDLSSVKRDIADLRERMAKLEGAVDVLTTLLVDRDRKPT